MVILNFSHQVHWWFSITEIMLQPKPSTLIIFDTMCHYYVTKNNILAKITHLTNNNLEKTQVLNL